MTATFLDLLEDHDLFGGAGPGYFTWDDAVNRKHGDTFKTADGTPLKTLTDEFLQTLALYNEKQSKLVSLLSYPTTDVFAADATDGNVKFERATEFGVPRGIETGDLITLGFDLKDYDAATRYTWKYLREASSDELARVHGEAMSADQELITKTILRRILTPSGATPLKNERGHNVYSLYNGADGVVPPKFEGNTFSSSTTQYSATNAATIDSGDIETAIKLFRITASAFRKEAISSSSSRTLLNPKRSRNSEPASRTTTQSSRITTSFRARMRPLGLRTAPCLVPSLPAISTACRSRAAMARRS